MDIRMARSSDGEDLQAIYAPIVTDTAISFETEPPSVAEMTQRVARTLPRYPWLVADEADAVAGYAYAGMHRTRQAYDWSVDVSIYVRPGHQGRGLGRALYTALFEILRLQRFTGAFAGIALPNPASVALHEAVGFVPVGVYRKVGWKHGAWHDVGWWQRTLAPTNGAAGPVRPLDDVAEPEIATAISEGVRYLR